MKNLADQETSLGRSLSPPLICELAHRYVCYIIMLPIILSAIARVSSFYRGKKKINRKFCRGAELSKGLLRLCTIFVCFHNWQNKNNGYGHAAPFPIATLTTVMVLLMKTEERSRGTGNNYYFYWSKANENGSGCFAHLFISLSVTVWLSHLLDASSAGFVHLFFVLFVFIDIGSVWN